MMKMVGGIVRWTRRQLPLRAAYKRLVARNATLEAQNAALVERVAQLETALSLSRHRKEPPHGT